MQPGRGRADSAKSADQENAMRLTRTEIGSDGFARRKVAGHLLAVGLMALVLIAALVSW